MTFNLSDCYWTGTPGTYGSARGALVSDPSSDAAFLAWQAANARATGLPWPADATDALDSVLLSHGLPATGLTLANLQAALVAAASGACAAILSQIYTDPAHQAAGQNAALIVAASGGAPASTSPMYAAYNAYASAWGMTPSDFASLISVLTQQSLALSGALIALEAASAAATTAPQLASALSTFETAIAAIVTTVNAASPPVTMLAPAAISIKGVNA